MTNTTRHETTPHHTTQRKQRNTTRLSLQGVIAGILREFRGVCLCCSFRNVSRLDENDTALRNVEHDFQGFAQSAFNSA